MGLPGRLPDLRAPGRAAATEGQRASPRGQRPEQPPCPPPAPDPARPPGPAPAPNTLAGRRRPFPGRAP